MDGNVTYVLLNKKQPSNVFEYTAAIDTCNDQPKILFSFETTANNNYFVTVELSIYDTDHHNGMCITSKQKITNNNNILTGPALIEKQKNSAIGNNITANIVTQQNKIQVLVVGIANSKLNWNSYIRIVAAN